MTLGSSIKQMMESFARALAITSANPEHTNVVKEVEYFGEVGNFDEVLSADVVRIIKEEIKIQMTDVKVDVEKKVPTGSVGSQVTQNINKAVSVSQNPASMGAMLISKLPHAAVIALATQLYPVIIDYLTRPGGPMDIRFRRRVEKEWNGFLDRQTQKNTQIGLRSMIVQSTGGFIQVNGAGSGNAQRLAKNTQGFIEKNNEIGLPAHALRFD